MHLDDHHHHQQVHKIRTRGSEIRTKTRPQQDSPTARPCAARIAFPAASHPMLPHQHSTTSSSYVPLTTLPYNSARSAAREPMQTEAASDKRMNTAHASNGRYSDEEEEDEVAPLGSTTGTRRSPSKFSLTTIRFGLAFFLFGTLNNISYVIILTAALELMPQGVPTGVVAFANIFPALCAKAIFPYFLRGAVQYRTRIWACSGFTFAGMMMIAWSDGALMRLLGISIASFCSGLGELTWLQLATRFKAHAGEGVGWFASGTGAAGFLGASAWWVVRPLGVRAGLSLLSVLPWLMAVSFFLLLPTPESVIAEREGGPAYAALGSDENGTARGTTVADSAQDEDGDGDEDEDAQPQPGRRESAERLARGPASSAKSLAPGPEDASKGVSLSFSEKMELLRPMLFVFVMPLAIVYLVEYTINQGVAPTLIYPLPTPRDHPILSHFIKKLSDYYPLYQLCYQTFVFISRSSISVLRLPAIPKRFLWAPTIVQCILFAILTAESLYAWFNPDLASALTIFLICVEGLAGGSAYVSVFHQIAMSDPTKKRITLPVEDGAGDPTDPASAASDELELIRRVQQQEFRIACIGVADTLGICLASLVSMPIQVGLCNAQVRQGRGLCKQV